MGFHAEIGDVFRWRLNGKSRYDGDRMVTHHETRRLLESTLTGPIGLAEAKAWPGEGPWDCPGHANPLGCRYLSRHPNNHHKPIGRFMGCSQITDSKGGAI